MPHRDTVVVGASPLWLWLAAGAVLVVGGLWMLSAPQPLPSSAQLEQPGSMESGRRVFIASHCASCHTSPGQPDRLRLGGGLALASNFGTLRAPNISPDLNDGIGRWSTRDLANAVLRGVSPAGKHYYPVFPYTSFTHLSEHDVSDLMAYLRTLPAVSGRPPPHDLPFPFNMRRLVGLWKRLYFKPGPLPAVAHRSPDWNRGRYLVEAQAHCAECHSSRNLLEAIKPATRFAGGRDPEGIGFVPNITPAGIGRWSSAQWVRFLSKGETPDLRIVGSTMLEVLTDTAQLSAADQQAMATYLITLPPRPTAAP